MPKILIEVSGGIIDNVYCDESADVLVIHHDVEDVDEEELDAYENLCEEARMFRQGLRSIY
jgi:hypothetical protein